jgi:hypothetical protein
MKLLLHTRNATLPLGSSATLREHPSSFLPGSVITPESTRGLPFPRTQRGTIPLKPEFWQYPRVRALGAKAA